MVRKIKTIHDQIMEEVRNNPILSEGECVPMSEEEMFDEEDFLEEMAIINSIVENYSEEKDKTKLKNIIDETLEYRRSKQSQTK